MARRAVAQVLRAISTRRPLIAPDSVCNIAERVAPSYKASAGWLRTSGSPTRSGPEGSSRNEFSSGRDQPAPIPLPQLKLAVLRRRVGVAAFDAPYREYGREEAPETPV